MGNNKHSKVASATYKPGPLTPTSCLPQQLIHLSRNKIQQRYEAHWIFRSLVIKEHLPEDKKVDLKKSIVQFSNSLCSPAEYIIPLALPYLLTPRKTQWTTDGIVV